MSGAPQSSKHRTSYQDFSRKDKYPGLFSLVCEIDAEVNVIFQINGEISCVVGYLMMFDAYGTVYLARARRKTFVEVGNEIKEVLQNESRTFVIKRQNIIAIQRENKSAK